MGYKCAIFGHKYGAVEVDRERTEDGDEVIVTVRETETCKRCDDTRVVSENKEVRTMETAADIVADDLDEDQSETATDTGEATDQRKSQPTPTEAVQKVAEEPDTAEEPTDTTEDAVDPEKDDAVILDDDNEEPTRERGEWPEEAEATAEQSQDDEESSPNWPDEDEEDDGDASEDRPGDIDPHPETDQAGSRGNKTMTIPEGTFYCPNCDFTTPVESSSLRAGDFCPECHKGALEHSAE